MPYAPALSVNLTPTDVARFMLHVDASGDCWPWQGSRNPRGYGRFSLGKKVLAAHRVAFAHFRKPVPEGKIVCHRCDNPPCVRPSHLFLGSPRENTADSISKGRFVKVTPRAPQAKCAQGHQYTPENTIRSADGTKRCRTCRRATEARRVRSRARCAKRPTMADATQTPSHTDGA